jgi:FkbM family methyltransferase
MNTLDAVSRLGRDMAGSWAVMPGLQAMRWCGAVALSLPSIVCTRKLYAADLMMRGEARFRALGQEFRFDIDAINATPGNGYAFLRELFVRNIYFRAFLRPRFDVCLDLGCNIALVSMVLRQLAGPSGRVVAVDVIDHVGNQFCAEARRQPGIAFEQAFLCSDVLRRDADRLARVQAEYGFDAALCATVGEVMARHGVAHVDFLKMDVEGAEFDIFAERCDWLTRVDNVAMEVHPDMGGDPRLIVDRLRENGFAVQWCDPYGFDCAMEPAGYVYGSRVGQLRN